MHPFLFTFPVRPNLLTMPTLQQLAGQGHAFAVFPEARIFKTPGKSSIQHLLFGDFITPPKNASGSYKKWSNSLLKTVEQTQWLNVRSRQVEGWMRMDDLQLERTLEVNFVDIGQGDGCHVVTPTDEHILIDAGEGDNMYRFLRWRFNLANKGVKLPKFSAVISHPDQDHWKGFEWLLSKLPETKGRHIVIDTLYHNGIIQRAGSTLGDTVTLNGQAYLKDWINDPKELKKILKKEGKKSTFENLLIGALKNFPGIKIETLAKTKDDEQLMYKDKKMRIEVLAPVPEQIGNKLMVRWFDPALKDIGKTKNGHSVVLMAKIGKMKILLGGDLNSPSADYLMEHYSGESVKAKRIEIEQAKPAERPPLHKEMQDIIYGCRRVFQADVAKSCHHGSSDITNELLAAINPIATVISSGDEESFCHPRPETLGAIGKFSRGDRPLIFSTELARSSPEFIELKTMANKTDKTRQRIVATYGMITVRSDGEKAVIAQELENPRSSFGLITKWHIDKIIWNDERGEFISKK